MGSVAWQESQSRLGSKAHHYGVGYHGHWARHKALIVRDGQWAGMDIPQDRRLLSCCFGTGCVIFFEAPDCLVSCDFLCKLVLATQF